MSSFKETSLLIQQWGLRHYHKVARKVAPHSPISSESALLLGIYLTVVGVANFAVQRSLFHASAKLKPLWTPGFAPAISTYNAPLITYVIAVLAIIGLFIATRILHYLPPLRPNLLHLLRRVISPLFVFNAIATLFAVYSLSRLCFAVAAIALLPQFLLFVQAKRSKPAELARASLPQKIGDLLFPVLLLTVIGLSLAVAYRAWYPVSLPNDYFVLPDRITIATDADDTDDDPAAATSASRSEVIQCLEAQRRQVSTTIAGSVQQGVFTKRFQELSGFLPLFASESGDTDLNNLTVRLTDVNALPLPKCTLDIPSYDLDRLYEPMVRTGAWQVQVGRILYHHSYIFVPANHFLAYGLSSPIPYLYGVGNTLFHALLMHLSSPTLSGYFDTFPIAQATGALAISLLVLYGTRSIYAAIAGFALLLSIFYRMDFEVIMTAPGFNPLRYFGLVLQLGSIFVIFRGRSWLRPFFLVMTTAASFFWNTEFAIIGLVGQLIALFSPQWAVSLRARFAWLIVNFAVAGAMLWWVSLLTQGYLKTMQLVIFGLLPILSAYNFIGFCLLMLAVHTYLAVRAANFAPSEYAARLSVLPVSALLMTKYLYTSSEVHLYFSLMLAAPLALLYFPWTQTLTDRTHTNTRSYWKFFSASSLTLLCLAMSVHYANGADRFRARMIEPFAANRWEGIGEQFTTVTPADPIVSRMKTIRAEMKPEDTLIFLSPFDHLMSFYANPEHYCGHFELITNLVTYEQNQQVINCARTAPNVLIVYDDAFNTSCPETWEANYYDPRACGVKALIRQNASLILKSLGNRAVLDKKVGSLSFYRIRPPKPRKPNAPPQ